MIELFGEIEVKRIEGQVNIMAVRPSGDCQAKTVTPTAEQQIVLPDSGYGALSRVTVEGAKLQAKTVAPATGAQEVKPDEGFLGLSGVTVEAAPLQEITAEIAAEIQHLVPDAGFYGFSGVTIKALPDAETAAFCESIQLPAVPAELADSYIVITEVTGGDTTMYLLAAAESAFFYGPGSVIGKDYDKFLGSMGAGTTYYTTAEGTSWTKASDLAAGSMVAEMTDTNRVVYSNHDIYQVEDDGSGNLSVDILYYAKSGLYGVAISDAYRIQRETMEDLGDQVNRLTGTAESMTPGRMTQKLEGLNIQLQELTVTATEEVQTITPPSGIYGFSKVIVEAVEDSGGGTGEGSAAEDTTFGNETVEDEVETGLLDYSGGKDEDAPGLPAIPDGEYQALFALDLNETTQARAYLEGKSRTYTRDFQTHISTYIFAVRGYYPNNSNGVHQGYTRVYMYSPNYFAYRHKQATSTAWPSYAAATKNSDGSYSAYYEMWSMQGGISSMSDLPAARGIPFYDIGLVDSYSAFTAAAFAIPGTAEPTRRYIAFSSSSQILYDGSSINNANGSAMTIYECDSTDANTWTAIGTTDGSAYAVGGYTLVWNSHDMLDLSGETVTQGASDAPVPETETTTVTRPAERDEVYTIDGNAMNDLIAAAQKVTGTDKPMTPAEAAAALEKYYAGLNAG